MNTVTVEAEFVKAGKHQKVVTEVLTMNSEEALNWFRGWKYCDIYNILEAKRIRENLRSFGWYIVKSKGGYQLMEEVTIDDFLLMKESRSNYHTVWVPSLKKRLIMRSVA